MTPGWRGLIDELDLWSSEGRTAFFWWRDDDAVAHTPALDRLLDLHAGSSIPLALAIIPARLETSLPPRLEAATGVAALQHGLAHHNHARPGEKKSEFPAGRALEDRLADMRAGQVLMKRHFGPRLSPVFVPPWNRIAADCLPALPGMGFTAVSAFKPRDSYWAASGLAALNTHLDPIDWHGGDNPAAAERCLAAARMHLHAMRSGGTPLQPLGFLTHHLRHDETIWTFAAEFLGRTAGHAAVRWLDVAAALAVDAPTGSSAPAVTPVS